MTDLMSSGPLEKLEIFKISGVCESSASLDQLLDHVATTSTPRLKRVELASPNVIWFLADQKYRVFFSHLTHFKVDVREMRDPADILPYFENLEVLEAYRLHLPMYPRDVDLPVVPHPQTDKHQNRLCAMDGWTHLPGFGRLYNNLAASPRESSPMSCYRSTNEQMRIACSTVLSLPLAHKACQSKRGRLLWCGGAHRLGWYRSSGPVWNLWPFHRL